MKTHLKLTLLLWCMATITYSQVGIPNNDPNKNAVLDLNQTDGTSTKGLLLPKVALNNTYDYNPMEAHVEGMKVYNTATAGTGIYAVTPGEYYNDGTQWIRTAVNSWQLGGNTNGAVKTLGTKDNFDLPVETSSTERMRITKTGQVLINTTTPLTGGSSAKLQINNGTTAGAIQIMDGTEADGKVLTSDANGVGTWKVPAVQYSILGYIPPTATTAPITTGNTTFYTGCFIDLPAGQWNIFSTMFIDAGGSAVVKPAYTNISFMSYFLSTSSTSNLPPTYASNIKSIILPPTYFDGSPLIRGYGTGAIPLTISTPQRIYVWAYIHYNIYNNTLPASPNTAIASGTSMNGGGYTQLYAIPITY